MSTSYLERREGRIAYDVRGTGPLVVCVHGMGDLRSVFDSTAQALVEAGYRVASMDLRGHGDSDDGFTSYDDVAAGTDVLALVEHLRDGGPALLLGNSMGAGAVTWAAAERPDRVAGLVLFGPFVRNPQTSRLAVLALRVGLLKPWGPAVWFTYYKKANPMRPKAELAEHMARMKASLRRGRHWQSFVRTTHTTHAPVEARLGEVHAPTFVVMGTRDPDWPDPSAEGRYVAEVLKAELMLVPGVGHYPMAECPELVAPAVIAFAGKLPARA